MSYTLIGGAIDIHGISSDLVIRFLINSYNEKNDIDDYRLDRLLSDDYVQVYYNTRRKEVIVVHRGSKTLADWVVNKNIWDEKECGERCYKSDKIEREATSKYQGFKKISIGHSLGGYLASTYSDGLVISVNPYVPKSDALKKIGDNEVLVRSTRDLPSILSKTQIRRNKIEIPGKSINPLTEHSYKVMKRL
jgi:hypothetical protein